MGAPVADRLGALEGMHAPAESALQPPRRDVSRVVRHCNTASI
jgi:hypothetical protein